MVSYELLALGGTSIQWYGVHVGQVGGQPRVVGLYLGANKLDGSLPASIGQLTALRRLHLQYNRELTGSLPESLFNLERLSLYVFASQPHR